MDLAIAAAAVLDGMGAFAQARAVRRRPIAVVGRDPRASGEFLEAAVVAGLASAGVDVLTLGVVPTPAVAYLTADLGAEIGVMLSASHNPAPDNGIKLFALGGLKLPDAVEDQIEAQAPGRVRAAGRARGRCRRARGRFRRAAGRFPAAGRRVRPGERRLRRS